MSASPAIQAPAEMHTPRGLLRDLLRDKGMLSPGGATNAAALESMSANVVKNEVLSQT